MAFISFVSPLLIVFLFSVFYLYVASCNLIVLIFNKIVFLFFDKNWEVAGDKSNNSTF